MKILVVGGTGATGRLLLAQLLERGHGVRAIVRSSGALPEDIVGHERLELVEASLLDLSDEQLTERVDGCDAVASCLGHNLTFKGIFLPPRRLVTEAVRRLCAAARLGSREAPLKFVLMGTTGVRDPRADEPRTVGERIVIGLISALVPPQADNERAAAELREVVGVDDVAIEWAVVRPDTLIDEPQVTPHEAHPAPIRSPIFDAGETSRINVARFMAELIDDEATWERWKGRMPVIYNKPS